MSISDSQYSGGRVFMQTYKDAIKTLQQTANRQIEKIIYQQFRQKVSQRLSTNFIQQIHKWNMNDVDYNSIGLDRDVKSFQFSQYFFLKYLKDFQKHTSIKQMNQYLKEINQKNDVAKLQ